MIDNPVSWEILHTPSSLLTQYLFKSIQSDTEQLIKGVP